MATAWSMTSYIKTHPHIHNSTHTNLPRGCCVDLNKSEEKIVWLQRAFISTATVREGGGVTQTCIRQHNPSHCVQRFKHTYIYRNSKYTMTISADPCQHTKCSLTHTQAHARAHNHTRIKRRGIGPVEDK